MRRIEPIDRPKADDNETLCGEMPSQATQEGQQGEESAESGNQSAPTPDGPGKATSRRVKNVELVAADRIDAILSELDQPARQRVLAWVLAIHPVAKEQP